MTSHLAPSLRMSAKKMGQSGRLPYLPPSETPRDTQFGSWVGKHLMKCATKEVHIPYYEAPRWPRSMSDQQNKKKEKTKGLPDEH